MFFPHGKALHENLATSYVLVDALIEDLCEGGFSGIVEILLHQAEGHVIIDRGRIAASLLKSDQKSESTTTVQELAARSRTERGRVSVYSYTTEVAGALARRADSEPLYTQLSTEFADLGKMLAKLARESDREWLIEVSTSGGAEALIYLKDGDCLVITPEGDIDPANRSDLTGSRALDDLLAESNREGATFDVYFRPPAPASVEDIEERRPAPPARPDEKAASTLPEADAPKAEVREAEAPASEPEVIEVETYKNSQAAADQSYANRANVNQDYVNQDHLNQDESFATDHANTAFEAASFEAASFETASMEQPSLGQTDSDAPAYEAAYSEEPEPSEPLPPLEAILPEAAKQGMTAHLFASTHVPESAGEAELIEVKRLMGEIARTVEESIRAVSQQSNFAMHMRAGQLRVAERYPFLDPFGNEFEYLAGEIAFVGKVKPDDFVAGLSEALRIALASAVQSVGQPARLRAIAAQDLRSLAGRYRAEFEEFGLDQAIERILEA
jgi:hypothetical protein